MENNIKVFRVHRALSWIYGLMFLLMLSLWWLIASSDKQYDIGVLMVIQVFIGFIFFIHRLLAKGAKEKKGWAKAGSAVIAFIMLLGFPIGTIIALYLLFNNGGWSDNAIQKE